MKNTSHSLLRRSLIVLAVAAHASACASAGVAQDKPSASLTTRAGAAAQRDMRAVHAAEQTWAAALLEGDAAKLATIIAPEFSFVGPDGEYEDATAYLEEYRSLPRLGVRVTGLDMQDVKTRMFGDTAIVTGRVVARVQVQASEVVETVRFTRVYMRGRDGWQMIAGQGTRIVPAATRTAQAEHPHPAPRE